VAAALADAIADGAIKGISPAVAKALKSSTDVDKAVAEAVKVRDLETSLKYMGDTVRQSFDDFAKTAADRVELARKYGVDMVKVEALNAKERTKLVEDALKQQVGGLQDIVDQLKYGSLYEGSAVDQRQALLGQIDKTRVAANAGEDGAADKLANLLDQLAEVSKQVYGTTGGFAQDRATILDIANSTIDTARQRISDAEASSQQAVAQTNTALDENNEQNAEMISQMQTMNTYLAQLAAAGIGAGATANLSALAQQARTSA